MDESLVVCGLEGVRDRNESRRGATGLERSFGGDQRGEIGPVDELHDQIQEAALLAGSVDREHVRVLDAGGDPGLANEAAAELPVLRQHRDDQLERVHSVELEIAGSVDDAHPAPTHQRVDLVTGEDAAETQLARRRVERQVNRLAQALGVLARGLLREPDDLPVEERLQGLGKLVARRCLALSTSRGMSGTPRRSAASSSSRT